ncbi:MAG: hypothetical protein HKN73_16360 [Gemmatimonadetes bacterium]|nr:hypothetical protein [Gemmatimonadota bacterium]
MRAPRRLLWLPPLLVSAAAAIAVSTSTALLLYDSPGLGRAIAVIGTITALSLGMGLWTGTQEEGEEVPSAARWWVGLLVALVVAAGFSGLWDAFQGFGASPAAQGTGLALMTALPTYFAGGVLGRLGAFSEVVAPGLRVRVLLGVGAGLALGAIAVLSALGRPILAVSAFLGAAIAASLGARIQGWIFDRVPRKRMELNDPDRPELRFRVWETVAERSILRALTDSGESLAEDPSREGSWQAGLRDATSGLEPVLFLGAGGWWRIESGAWWIHEPDPGVAALAARGFGWSPETVLEHPGFPTKGCWVVVGRRSLDPVIVKHGGAGGFVAAARAAGVRGVWVGGVRSPLPDELADAARSVGWEVASYSGLVPGRDVPLRWPARRDRLWYVGPPRDLPTQVGALQADGWAAGGEGEVETSDSAEGAP